MRLTGDSLLLTPTWYMVVHRWSSQRGGEGEEGGGEAPGGWDCAGVPAGLSWGGVRRQPPVPGPRSLPAEVWQLLFTLALQECLLQSLLHQISLNTDTGGAKECVCSCMCVCVCRWRFLWWQPVWVCVFVCAVCMWGRKWYQIYSGQKPPEGDKETHLEPDFGDWTNMCVLYVYACPKIHPCYNACHRARGRGVCIPVVYSPPVLAALT